jgi:uncharacterized protein YeaO (DUF488 family)
MIKIKHLFDALEPDDGARLWVEPIGLTKDLMEWCAVNHLLSELGPPITIWRWFQAHPEGYEYFRAKYHEYLARGPKRRETLRQLAAAALQEDFTLVHQGDDPNQNSATALYEFLTELQAYLQPE